MKSQTVWSELSQVVKALSQPPIPDHKLIIEGMVKKALAAQKKARP